MLPKALAIDQQSKRRQICSFYLHQDNLSQYKYWIYSSSTFAEAKLSFAQYVVFRPIKLFCSRGFVSIIYRARLYFYNSLDCQGVTPLIKRFNLTNTPACGEIFCAKILLKSWVVKVTSWSENDLKTIVIVCHHKQEFCLHSSLLVYS